MPKEGDGVMSGGGTTQGAAAGVAKAEADALQRLRPGAALH
jgi:hypothetical protein